MLKALLKKQFLELNSFYFQDKKTGQLRSKKKVISTVGLYAGIMVFLGFMFFMMCQGFAPLLGTDTPWLYYTMTGIMAVAMGVFGSVFNTYAGLYHAKDNEMLLSMPIPASRILFARLFGVALMSLMYEAVVFIPAIIERFLVAPVNAAVVINSVVLLFALLIIVMVLTCFFGWIVALLASKFKNKSFLTVLLSLVVMGVYFFISSQSYTIIENLVNNSAAVGVKVKTWLYPFYLLGKAGEGSVLSLVLFILIDIVLFALTWVILSKTFTKIATKKDSSPKKVYVEKAAKLETVDKAVFRKELKRFTASANYMLNTALGSVFMLIAAVLIIVYKGKLAAVMPMLLAHEDLIPVIVVATVLLCAALNDITAPSISLEGKSIWILQSLPVPTATVLKAKQKVHLVVTAPPAALLCISLSYVLGLDIQTAFFAVLAVLSTVSLSASAGLALNLKKPNLTWTNEMIPVKQSMAAMVMIFGGWALAVVFGGGGYFLAERLGGFTYVTIFFALTVLATRYLNRWLYTRGAAIFEEL